MSGYDRDALGQPGTTRVWRGGLLLAERYRLEKPVGEGAMGVVWRARDEARDGRLIAVKALPDAMRGDPQGIKQLRREADLAIELRHPAIVGVNHLEIGPEGIFLIMEFVEGASLAVRLAEMGRLPAEEVVTLAERLCEALGYAHARGVLHLDVKPGNVLMAAEGAKLSDFGIAVSVRDSAHRLSRPGTIGTLPYMAPEQILGEDPTTQTDLYQLGATLYECLAGHPPFHRGALEYQIVHVAPRPLPDVPEALAAAIMRALEKAPAARPASAEEVRRLLRMPSRPRREEPSAEAGTPRGAAGPDVAEMVEVPAGEFLMGSEEAGDEEPPHKVYLDAFAIDKHAVTNARWKAFMDAGGYRERKYWSAEGWQWRDQGKVVQPAQWEDGKFNGSEQPVVGVSWSEAEAFCRWAGKRLPTEAEWEKAARGTDGRTYPWGNDWDKSRANSGESGLGKTTPVGAYPQGASPYGAQDMAGNVWEWVGDWYDGNYYKQSPARNPKGPDSGSSRVLRGGSWTFFPPVLPPGDVPQPLHAGLPARPHRVPLREGVLSLSG